MTRVACLQTGTGGGCRQADSGRLCGLDPDIVLVFRAHVLYYISQLISYIMSLEMLNDVREACLSIMVAAVAAKCLDRGLT